jgi:Polyketide cyclase / dehydrase and lipid transport
MASVEREIQTRAPVEAVWDAVRDVGALHTRLVPGFVVDTVLDRGVRVVTFANGLVARETIVTLDDERRRLVWSADGATAQRTARVLFRLLLQRSSRVES